MKGNYSSYLLILSTVAIISIILISCSGLKNPPPYKLQISGEEKEVYLTDLTPDFAWEADHTFEFWQIRLASLEEILEREKGDLWDSGKRKFDGFPVRYDGPVLKGKELYYWNVRVWDSKGTVSDYSNAHSFEIGMTKNDFQGNPLFDSCCQSFEDSLCKYSYTFFLEKELRKSRIYISHNGPISVQANQKLIDEIAGSQVQNTRISTAKLTSYFRWGENRFRIWSKGPIKISLVHDFTDGSSHQYNGDSLLIMDCQSLAIKR